MRFDDILELIDGFGRYQKWVFFLTCIPNMLSGFYMLNPVFILGIPEHRCAIPGYENDTYSVQDAEHQRLINMTIPLSNKKGHKYDGCQMYAYPSNSINEVPANATKIECDRWVYDKSVFEETFVSKIDLVCDKDIWIANATMLFYGGMLFGSIASGILADWYGRKKVLYVALLFMFASSLGLAFVHTYALFVIVNFILGAAIVATFMPAYIISLEMTCASKRVWPGVISDFPYVGGLMALAGIAYLLRDWFTIQLVCAIPGILLIPYWWLIPESPRWLLTQGRGKEAEQIIRRIAKWNKTESQLPANLSAHLALPPEPEQGKFWQLCSSKILSFRTSLIFFNWTVVAFAYFGLSLNTENLAGDLYLNFFLSGLVEIPAYICVILLVDRVGRRVMYCACMILGGVSCACTTFAIIYGGEELEALTVTLAMVGKLGVTAAYCVAYIQSAELLPTIVRNAGMGGASVFARIGTMVSPYLVDLGEVLGDDFGEALPLIVFGGMSILSGILSLFLPETLNKNLPETIEEGEWFGRSGRYFILKGSRFGKSYEVLQQSTSVSNPSSVEICRTSSRKHSETERLLKPESKC